jgi:hypothetical protein
MRQSLFQTDAGAVSIRSTVLSRFDAARASDAHLERGLKRSCYPSAIARSSTQRTKKTAARGSPLAATGF